MKKNIRKVKRFQKPLICLIGILIFVLGMIVDSFMKTNADEKVYEYESNNIDYDNSTSNLNATNVKDAIDELYGKVSQCPNGKLCVELSDNYNNDIVKAYTYDESVCVTGDETGCVETSCYKASVSNACPSGTIIDYKVNDTETVRFHVLHDDGRTMTLQSQKNTVYNVAWYASTNDPSQGPQTIMSKLKEKTDGWTNVNPITITDKTISFLGVNDIYNACAHDNAEGNVTCLGNRYDMSLIANTYNARLITIQEATNPDIGQCKSYVNDSKRNVSSCRIFMNNFLHRSFTLQYYCRNTSLCVDDTYTENGASSNNGYWTMGAGASWSSAWRVYTDGFLSDHYGTGAGIRFVDFGARAVVVVNK